MVDVLCDGYEPDSISGVFVSHKCRTVNRIRAFNNASGTLGKFINILIGKADRRQHLEVEHRGFFGIYIRSINERRRGHFKAREKADAKSDYREYRDKSGQGHFDGS